MTKLYEKNVWSDEVLADSETYQLKDDNGDVVYSGAELALATPVVSAGTPLTAERMNNIEDGIDAIDDRLDTLDTAVAAAPVLPAASADNDLLLGSGSAWSKKTLGEATAILNTAQKIDTFQLSIAGGNLVTDGSTGWCDNGETVKTPLNNRMYRINKYEKGDLGHAELPYLPSAWNLGTLTAKIKFTDVGGNVLHSCDSAWTAASNVTASAETTIKLEGSGSCKMACAAALAAGALIATQAVTSVDLTGAKYVSFWFQSSVALNAGDVQFLIDDTAACASPLKSWDIPAIAANTWTKVQISCGSMAGTSAVISIGLKQVVDKGAMNLYIDQVCWQGDVTWVIGAYASTPGDDLDLAAGTYTTQEITGTARFYQEVEATFPALTVGQSPALGDRLVFVVTRKNHASDTHGAGKVCFAGCEIVMTRG